MTLHCACGQHLRVDDPRPGRVIQCPDCGAWQRIPPAESRPTTYRRHRRRRDDGVGSILSYPVSDGPGVALLVVLPPVMWPTLFPIRQEDTDG